MASICVSSACVACSCMPLLAWPSGLSGRSCRLSRLAHIFCNASAVHSLNCICNSTRLLGTCRHTACLVVQSSELPLIIMLCDPGPGSLSLSLSAVLCCMGEALGQRSTQLQVSYPKVRRVEMCQCVNTELGMQISLAHSHESALDTKIKSSSLSLHPCGYVAGWLAA